MGNLYVPPDLAVRVSFRIHASTLLCALSLALACSGEAPTPAAGGLERTCNNVETEAVRLAVGHHYAEALERYGEAIDLCEDVPLIRDRILNWIATIAQQSTEHCGLAKELHGRAGSTTGTESLRARAHLSLVCRSPADLDADLERLVQRASRDVYHEAATEMGSFVRSHERVQLYKWASDAPRHLQSLREATRELCATEKRIALVLDSMNRVGIGHDNGLSRFGYWMLQPAGSMDEHSRACLTHVASLIEARAAEFGPSVSRDMTAVVEWVNGGFQAAPANH